MMTTKFNFGSSFVLVQDFAILRAMVMTHEQELWQM